MTDGDWSGALKSFQECRAITEKLAVQNPGNADWQRDLSVSFGKVGEVQEANGDLLGALKSYQDGGAIAEKLAAQDPGNTGWQDDLFHAKLNIGIILTKQNKIEEARSQLERSRQIVDQLASAHPGNYLIETDRAYVRWTLMDCLETRNQTDWYKARQLLREAADILHKPQQSPGLQPREADLLHSIEMRQNNFGK